MSERRTQSIITFRHPFTLSALDEPVGAGNYVVEMLEESLEGVSFVAYRRVSTTMTITSNVCGAVLRQLIEIDPAELELAIVRDKEIQATTNPTEVDSAAARL